MTATGHSDRAKQIVDHITQRAKDGKDGAIVVRTDETAIQELRRRIDNLEALPPKPANDPAAIPLAIGKIIERLDALENRPTALLPTEPDETQLQQLGQDLAELSAAVLMHIRVLQKRVEACEARFDELPAVLAQIQSERRRA